jgi:phosphoribosylformimino-5-aminoimidazole carboxamide ribotide isomerase
MILYPAIDLKGGQCVRLFQGRMDDATVFANPPGAQAVAFEQAGFEWLHVVDLDGAVEGGSRNQAAVREILASTKSPVQLGGGVRTLRAIESWLNEGIKRVILGTIAARDPALVKAAAKEFPNSIAVGIDARNGYVAVEGWLETTDVLAVDLATAFEDAGVSAIIVTDIGRDGMKSGVNVALTGQLADTVSVPIIASGGVKDVSDVTLLKSYSGKQIAGCIIGRALYDGAIDPAEALALARV